jgi:hypothetical protein
VAGDPSYPPEWKTWILAIRHQVGIIDIADLIYVQSDHAAKRGGASATPLFGD